MRRSPLHRQSSGTLLPASRPGPRGGARAHSAPELPIFQAAAVRREGRGPKGSGPALLGRASHGACALPPGLHLGIGRKRERETGTSPGLWCGEKLRQKRRGGEGAGTALSHNLSATLRREEEKGRRSGREWGCHPPTLT